MEEQPPKLVVESNLWISVKDKHAPMMETVLLAVDGKVIVGWNETTCPEEDSAYCSWERWPETCCAGENVTHWMPLPKAPKEPITM